MRNKAMTSMAPNSTNENLHDYAHGEDGRKLMHQEMPNNRMNDYITNQYAGPGSHKGPAKVKGKSEHAVEENEFGDDYQV